MVHRAEFTALGSLLGLSAPFVFLGQPFEEGWNSFLAGLLLGAGLIVWYLPTLLDAAYRRGRRQRS